MSDNTFSESLLDIPQERVCSNPNCDNTIGYRPPCDIKKNKSGKFYCSRECHNISKRPMVMINDTTNHKQAMQSVKLPMTWIRQTERVVANNGHKYSSRHAFYKIAIGKLLEHEIALLEAFST